MIVDNQDKTFKVKFNSSTNNFNKIKFKSSNIGIDSNFQPTPDGEEVYYDSIIDYDGGGVDGYGYD